MKACLIDWQEKDCVVPWMIFDTLAECIVARQNGNSSWPSAVCEIEDKPCGSIPTRRALLEKRSGPYRNETVAVYKPLSKPIAFYDVAESV